MAFWLSRKYKLRVPKKRYLASFSVFIVLVVIFSLLINNSPRFAGKRLVLGWYSSGWGYRMQITFDHTKVGTVNNTDQSSFPVLISSAPNAITALKSTGNGGHVALTTGNDIVFTDSDGATLLNYEIENYVASTGELEAWVKIPTLSHSTNTSIYMYYGNASAAANTAANSQATWSNGYAGVWHLNQSGNGTAGEFADSTSNGNGMQGGAGTAGKTPTRATGEIGFGQSFNGSVFMNKTSPTGMPAINATNQTFSAWYKVTTNPNANQNILVDEVSGTSSDQLTFRTGPNLGITDWGGGSIVLSASPPTANQWDYVVWTFNNGATPKSTLYFNGSSSGTTSSTALQTGSTTSTEIGSYDTTPSEGFNGSIDEARISTVTRSADWISTEYNNQNAPGSFETFGSEAAENPPSAPTLINPASGATNISAYPLFSLRSSDAEGDYIEYKIQLYASDCASAPPPYGSVQTFDETSSQSGWQQQDANSFQAYDGSPTVTDSSVAYYQLSGTALNPNTTYCWKAAGIDPAGYDSFGSFSSTQTFSTGTSEVQIRGGSNINGGTTVQ